MIFRNLICLVIVVSCSKVLLGSEPVCNRPSLGVHLVDIKDAMAVKGLFAELLRVQDIRWPGQKGAVILLVAPKSSAAEAGLRPGDLLLQIGETSIEDSDAAISEIEKLVVDQKVQLVIRYPEPSGKKVKWKRRAIDIQPQKYITVLSNQMMKSVDKLDGTTLIRHHNDEAELTPTKATVRLIEYKGNLCPVLRIMHRSPDWLFVRSYTVDIDGNKFQIPLELRDRKSENTHEYCWEWSSHLADPTNVNDEVLQICKMLKDCRSATIFYHGDQYRDEYKLSASDTHEIGTVMEYWRCNSTNQAR